jgi:hypothetical protein
VLSHALGCESTSGDTAIRIREATARLDGVFENICDSDYAPALRRIGEGIRQRL